MKKLLIVVDMQNDFVDGSLGTEEARKIVPNVAQKIHDWDGDILATMDTHQEDYLNTNEGRHLPVKHCVLRTDGWVINKIVGKELSSKPLSAVLFIQKENFGSTVIPEVVKAEGYDYIELIGLCTDICVISNALILKAHFPEIDISVDVSCCAGVTVESHKAAILTMKMCQIDIIGETE